MRLWPVIIDSVPRYLGSSGVSLLGTPMGTGRLAAELIRRIRFLTSDSPTILAPPGSGSDYCDRMKDVCPTALVVTTPGELGGVLSAAEFSDAVLFVDPRCLPVDAAQLRSLLSGPRYAACHLVSFARVAGSREQVDVDPRGLVTNVHRYCEPSPFPFIAGLAASLVPVSSGIVRMESAFPSLGDLRQHLASCGVPNHDIAINSHAFDLSTEQGLLAAAERSVLDATGGASRSNGASTVFLGAGHLIHPTVRFLGPVVVQSNVRIDANATIVGPSILGARSHVAENAVVAHVVIGNDSIVRAAPALRGRVWFSDVEEQADPRERTSMPTPSYAEHLAGLATYHVERRAKFRERTANPYVALKRLIDLTVAAFSVALLSPLFLLVAALVKITSPDGPALYADEREGLGGRLFRCLKFRTMCTGANALQRDLKRLDSMDGPHFKLDADPRVTRFGRILRATNIDELPQLVNVLFGEMSLVGPRPSPFRENQICIPWREGRLSMRPGLTGLWQVCRRDRASGDFHQWIEYDLLYVQHASLLLDLKILAATIFTFGGRIPVPVSWMIATTAQAVERPARSATENTRRAPLWKGARGFSRIGRQSRPVRPA